jgi:endoglucanase Acf2
MLAIQARTFSNYYYISANNTNHPTRFVGNAVAGILFENKVDYTSTSLYTYTSAHLVLQHLNLNRT